MKTELIVALDVSDKKKALLFVDRLKDYVNIFKIGSELFTSEGPAIVKSIIKKGCNVFLDLKFHDIPNTVARSAEVCTELGVFMFNLHISGGSDMMKTTVFAVEKKSKKLKIEKPIILGVTVLTSIAENMLKNEFGIKQKITEFVVNLAKLGKICGLDGVVSSSLEINSIRKTCGNDFIIVTPGIRAALANKDDQKRINTPANAAKLGANYIVVGRQILNSEDPVNAVKMILKEMKNDARRSN